MRQSHAVLIRFPFTLALRPQRWRRQITRSNRAGEVVALVRAIAKRLIRGLPAAAEGDSRASGEAENLAILVDNFEVALDPHGSIAENGYFSG
jgi:hypothetical protein